MPLIDIFGNNRTQQQRTPTLPPLTPDEQESLLRSLGGKTIGAASYVGGVLDKLFGDRAVRSAAGLAAGNPKASYRELLSIIPGSDTLGITNPEHAVSGRDLYNGGDINHPGIADDLAGLALEIGMGPSTYLSMGAGAASKGGQVLKKIGMFDKAAEVATKAAGKTVGKRVGKMTTTVEDILNAGGAESLAKAEMAAGGAENLVPLLKQNPGGLFGIGLPFKEPAFTVGSGPISQAIGGAMDKIGSAARWSGPGRTLANLFSPDAGNRMTRVGQEAAKERRIAEAVGRADVLSKAFRIHDRLSALGLPQEQLTRLLDRMVEVPGGVLDPRLGKHTAAAAAELAGLPPNVQAELQDIAGTMQKHQADWRQQSLDLGQYVPELSSEYLNQHSARYANAAGGPSRSRPAGQLFDQEAGKARKAMLDIPEGRSAIEALATDPLLTAGRATKPLQANRRVLNEYLGVSNDDVLKSFDFQNALKQDNIAKVMGDPGLPDSVRQQMTDHIAFIKAKQKQAKELANYFGKREAKRFYGHPVGDFVQYGLNAAGKSIPASSELLNFMAKHHTPLTDGVVPLTDILAKTKFVLPGGTAPSPEAIAQLQKLGVGDITKVGLPADVAEELARTTGMGGPGPLAPGIEGLDSLTNLTKALWTTPWPGFQMRNRASGIAHELDLGTFNPTNRRNVAAFLKGASPILEGAGEYPAVKKILIERGLPNTPENASKVAKELGFAHEVFGPAHSQGAAADNVPDVLGDLSKSIPGETPAVSLMGYLKDLLPTSKAEIDPRNIRGVKHYKTGELRTETQFAPVRAGEKLGKRVEDLNRGQPFYELLRQGYDPAEAAKIVKSANVDYSARAFTDFEKKYMTRLMPFYKYTSRMVPHVAKRVSEHPGGVMAQAIRAGNSFKDDKGFTPDYIGSSLSVPLPGGGEGMQRYLTGLGLPHEVLNQLATVGPGGLQKTGMDLLGQLNPLIKTPLELATGKQFFSGRDLKDLDARSGRIMEQAGVLESPKSVPYWLDELLMNSPAARAVSTVGQLSDSRKSALIKAINTLSGARISDVDTAKQQEISARNILEEMLRGRPGVGRHESLYVSPENAATMDPETLKLMSLLQSIQKQGAQRRKERSAP